MTDRDKDDTEGGAPRPGHFLPGGAGESTPETQRRKPAQPSLGQPRDLAPPSARPTPSGTPGWQSARQRDPQRDPQRDHRQPAPPEPQRRRAPLIAAFVAGGLLIVAGIVFASTKIVDSFDDLTGQPISGSSEKPTLPVTEPEPSPTVTVTAPPPPSGEQILKSNKLYVAGRLTAACKEPANRPTSQAAVTAYFRAMHSCLDAAWAPLIRKAGYEFRSPKLVVYTGTDSTACGRFKDSGHYCDGGETVFMPWQNYVRDYKRTPTATRLDMLESFANVYGFHVQQLSGILPAWGRSKNAASKAAENAIGRRFTLQAFCLGTAFIGADKAAIPLRGALADTWSDFVNRSDPVDPATTGSRKAHTYWATRGFRAAGPAGCNTWAAGAKLVS